MTMDDAIKILGINATKTPTTNMVRALGMMTWLNTPEDERRRDAGKFILRRWKAYCAECNRRRDRKCA